MIGLFLGETDFPKKILVKIKKKNINYFIIDLTKKSGFLIFLKFNLMISI